MTNLGMDGEFCGVKGLFWSLEPVASPEPEASGLQGYAAATASRVRGSLRLISSRKQFEDERLAVPI